MRKTVTCKWLSRGGPKTWSKDRTLRRDSFLFFSFVGPSIELLAPSALRLAVMLPQSASTGQLDKLSRIKSLTASASVSSLPTLPSGSNLLELSPEKSAAALPPIVNRFAAGSRVHALFGGSWSPARIIEQDEADGYFWIYMTEHGGCHAGLVDSG